MPDLTPVPGYLHRASIKSETTVSHAIYVRHHGKACRVEWIVSSFRGGRAQDVVPAPVELTDGAAPRVLMLQEHWAVIDPHARLDCLLFNWLPFA
jgi:ABC-type uncharacterized transport system ATPase component